MEKWTEFLLVGFCYLLGSFPTGVVLSRKKYGIDVREMGSGNIGATNVTRVFGWYAGVLVFMIDFLKGVFPIWLLQRYDQSEPWLMTFCSLALVLGHCFSVYLRFRGGKGVATSLGCLVVVAPWAAALSALSYLILLLTTKISAVGSLGGILVTLIYIVVAQPEGPVTWLIVGMSIIVVVRHRKNLQRLLSGWVAKRRQMQRQRN
jgi:acyl phosphate:glycerol-3-phosphate acyltransferase